MRGNNTYAGAMKRTGSALVFCCILLGGCGESTGTPANYVARLSGSMPAVQSVGSPFDMSEHVSNTGDALTSAVLDLSGCSDHWVVDSVTTSGSVINQENTEQYDLGSLNAGSATSADITLVPKDAGSHTCDIALYRGDGSGGTSGDSLYDATVTVAINP